MKKENLLDHEGLLWKEETFYTIWWNLDSMKSELGHYRMLKVN